MKYFGGGLVVLGTALVNRVIFFREKHPLECVRDAATTIEISPERI